MSDETDKQIKDRLQEIFPSPEVASKIVDLVVHNRPLGWSRSSNSPYYKQKYAEQIKVDIDNMIKNGGKLVYRYSVWCGENEERMSKQTLYNRINQSIHYLLDKMDADGRYRQWKERVRTERDNIKKAVVIYYIPGFGTDVLKADEVLPQNELPRWRYELDSWLEGDEVKPFMRDGLMLSDDEIKQLKIELSQLSNVQYSITHGHVKVIKTI